MDRLRKFLVMFGSTLLGSKAMQARLRELGRATELWNMRVGNISARFLKFLGEII